MADHIFTSPVRVIDRNGAHPDDLCSFRELFHATDGNRRRSHRSLTPRAWKRVRATQGAPAFAPSSVPPPFTTIPARPRTSTRPLRMSPAPTPAQHSASSPEPLIHYQHRRLTRYKRAKQNGGTSYREHRPINTVQHTKSPTRTPWFPTTMRSLTSTSQSGKSVRATTKTAETESSGVARHVSRGTCLNSTHPDVPADAMRAGSSMMMPHDSERFGCWIETETPRPRNKLPHNASPCHRKHKHGTIRVLGLFRRLQQLP